LSSKRNVEAETGRAWKGRERERERERGGGEAKERKADWESKRDIGRKEGEKMAPVSYEFDQLL